MNGLYKAKWAVRQAVQFGLLKRYPDDQFIASFPRSGSTWLRTIITNVLDPEADSNPDVFNGLIPGLSLRNIFPINQLHRPRLIATHSRWCANIDRAVYLVRDGRDALISLYHYQTTRQGRPVPFERFYADYRQGMYGFPWHVHVTSWLQAGKAGMGDKLLVVRFEDFRRHPIEVAADVLQFLRVEASTDQIEEAVEKSSLERMRQIERQRRGEVESPDASFYRGGRQGQWRAYFTPGIEAEFCREAVPALRLAGYNEWQQIHP